MIMKLGMEHYELKLYTVYINDDSELTLTYFTTMSILVKLFVCLLRSSSDDRILWIRSGIEIMWLIEHVANGGQLFT